MADNVYSNYGVLPITIDNSRTIPYVQYALLRQGDSVLQPGSAGAEIPAEWAVNDTGPIFSISLMVLSESLSEVSPTDFASILKPTVTSVSPTGTVHTLEWDSSTAEFSAWPLGIPSDEKFINMQRYKELCITTKPLEASKLNELSTGVVHFSLMPTPVAEYNGVKLGVLAVNYKLKKTRAVL